MSVGAVLKLGATLGLGVNVVGLNDVVGAALGNCVGDLEGEFVGDELGFIVIVGNCVGF